MEPMLVLAETVGPPVPNRPLRARLERSSTEDIERSVEMLAMLVSASRFAFVSLGRRRVTLPCEVSALMGLLWNSASASVRLPLVVESRMGRDSAGFSTVRSSVPFVD